MEKRKILIAAAWPYGNNSMHLGNLSSILPADVLARYHRLCGDDVLYVSGTDCHGTPITITAEREQHNIQIKLSQTNITKNFVKVFWTKSWICLLMTFCFHHQTPQKITKQVVSDLFLVLEKEFISKKKEHFPVVIDFCHRS